MRPNAGRIPSPNARLRRNHEPMPPQSLTSRPPKPPPAAACSAGASIAVDLRWPGAMLGRIFAVDSVDMVGLEDIGSKVDADLTAQAADLESQGLSGEALNKSLAQFKRQGSTGRSPPVSHANDRSRWCTVRALVEGDMRVEDAPYAIDKVIQQPNWDTIDMVKHDGHLYSSKPPLLPTLMAGVYWPIYRFTGVTLARIPTKSAARCWSCSTSCRWSIYFVLLAAAGRAFWHDRLGADFRDGGGRFGTFLDHLRRGDQQPSAGGRLRGGGLLRRRADLVRRRARLRFSSSPGCSAHWRRPTSFRRCRFWRALGRVAVESPAADALAFVPAVLVVAAAFFGTNWIAHSSSRPAYMHHSGPTIGTTIPSSGTAKTIESYWRNPAGLDRGEPSPVRLRRERFGRPSRHFFAHARLAAELSGHVRLDALFYFILFYLLLLLL